MPSKLHKTPILVNAPQSLPLDSEELRNAGCTDILLSPFSFDDLKTRLHYILTHHQEHENISAPDLKEQPDSSAPPDSSPKDDQALVHTLLDHYLQHHEAVLKQLEFAQSATSSCLQEVENVRHALKGKDNTTLANFSKFETMWEEIIKSFVRGGISEDDLFKIEALIAEIPKDIKKHYDQLTQQDKSFLALVKTLNHNAYRKARSIALNVQERPNPLTGLSSSDYARLQTNGDPNDDDGIPDSDLFDEDMAFIFSPMGQN